MVGWGLLCGAVTVFYKRCPLLCLFVIEVFYKRLGAVQAEQAKLQVAASEHQRTLQQQERMLRDMMLKLHDLQAVQVAM